MAILPERLNREWGDLKEEWYSIYQWPRTCRVAYTECISGLILDAFNRIRLVADNLRRSSFRLCDHDGRIQLQTNIEQLTEKRFVRALYNQRDVPELGEIIDYEVPLKATEDAAHGDIDLLAKSDHSILCIEAKHPTNAESVLKAVLQAFVYTSLARLRHEVFAKEFSLPEGLPLAPAILVGANTAPGRQLRNLAGYPTLMALIRRLNQELDERTVGPFQFFLIDNAGTDLQSCLTTSSRPDGVQRAVFVEGFTLRISRMTLEEAKGVGELSE